MEYKPTELEKLGLLYGKPKLQKIYNMIWDGRLKAGDTGTSKRADIYISDEQIAEHNKLAASGKLPQPKKRPVKQPKSK